MSCEPSALSWTIDFASQGAAETTVYTEAGQAADVPDAVARVERLQEAANVFLTNQLKATPKA